MTDDLAERPVLRIYTEAISDKGGVWAFKPYTSAHTVFVEESNYLDLKDRIEALTAERDRLRAALRDGRRLWAIAQDDRVRLLIQLEQCEASHE